MTIAKQLYSLQDLDLTLDRIHKEESKAQQELSSGVTVERMEVALQAETDQLQEVQSQSKVQRLEADTQRERSSRLDEQLYGGSVSNPRDLQSLEQEATNARELLEQQDAGLLELTVRADETEAKRAALEQELSAARTAWQDREAELQQTLERAAAESQEIGARRESLAATLDQTELQRYENLRRAKSGLAVAKVERGLCQACRMALPTQQQQHLRGGRRTVLCSSCGRMLFLS